MPSSINDSNLTAYLTAYADAELDAERSAQVVHYLEEHPDALQLLREMHQLRAAAWRMVRGQTPAVPEQLQKRIEEMTSSSPAAAPIDSAQPLRRMPRFTGIAAALLVALALGLFVGMRLSGVFHADVAATQPSNPASVVPASLVSDMLQIHVNCSRFPSHHTAPIPQELGSLSDALKQGVSSAGPYPDLTSLGFRVIGAGPCAKPLESTVHILYAAIDPEQNETLSIFAQPVSERLKLEPAKLYAITASNSPHPALVWRSGRVTYFLVGDHQATVKRAQAVLAAGTQL